MLLHLFDATIYKKKSKCDGKEKIFPLQSTQAKLLDSVKNTQFCTAMLLSLGLVKDRWVKARPILTFLNAKKKTALWMASHILQVGLLVKYFKGRDKCWAFPNLNTNENSPES